MRRCGVGLSPPLSASLFAGIASGPLEELPHNELFWSVGVLVGVAGLAALLLSGLVSRLTGGLE